MLRVLAILLSLATIGFAVVAVRGMVAGPEWDPTQEAGA